MLDELVAAYFKPIRISLTRIQKFSIYHLPVFSVFVRAKTNSINMLVQQPAERVTSPPRPQDITSSVKLRRKNRDPSAEAIKKRNRYSGGDFRIGSPARGIAFHYQFILIYTCLLDVIVICKIKFTFLLMN